MFLDILTLLWYVERHRPARKGLRPGSMKIEVIWFVEKHRPV